MSARALLLALFACESGKVTLSDSGEGEPDQPQDILSTDLALDLSTLTGRATIVVQPASDASSVKFNIKGLILNEISVDGVAVEARVSGGLAKIPVEPTGDPVTVVVDYTFTERTPETFDGWMPSLGVTFLWPDGCGELFPCDPSPVDGVTFTMSVTGIDPTLTAVYPSTTTSDAPSYMPGIAVGAYEQLSLGTTAAGTALYAWYLPEDDGLADAEFGTTNLLAAFDFIEATYGPYAFGPEAGTVEVDWGADSTGGMEHHPYFHVGKDDFWNEETQVHEAAHGWFGDGVRLACWEDFVLSEGTVTYMAAHALEEVGGPDLWPAYVADFVTPICDGRGINTVVLPDETCNEIDFEDSDLWSLAPYMKGACFYEDVADLIGPELLDQVIADFYRSHVNQPARMSEMIEALEAADPANAAQIEVLESEWLRTLACPEDYATRCRSHGG